MTAPTIPPSQVPPEMPPVADRPHLVSQVGKPELVDASNNVVRVTLGILALVALLAVSSNRLVAGFSTSDVPALPRLTVPELDSSDIETARTKLEKLGFVVTVKFQVNEAIPKGKVFAQIPSAGGLVEQGDTVEILVSDGPLGISVPVVAAQQSLEALNFVNSSGLSGELVDTYDDTIRVGEVIGTNPPQGTRVGAGTKVQLLVSRGPAPRTVPDILNKPAQEAMAALGRNGLSIGKITRPYRAGVVEGTLLEVDPAVGTQLPLDYPVNVVIADPQPKVEVSYFVGLLQASAEQLAKEAELTVTVKFEQQPPGSPFAGRVINQGVPPGSKVSKGTAIEITVVQSDPLPPATPTTTQ